MKVVINRCYGGCYALSEAAYAELGMPWDGYGFARSIDRSDPRLVECLERLGDSTNGEYASLEVVEIPDDVEWEIDDYNGMEHVAEKHRTWP